MKRIKSIQFKAAFLCIVFASNTVIGFACAIGVNVDLIRHIIHHDEPEGATESPEHILTYGENHHHHHENHENINSKKDDRCCNTKVVSFEQLNKIVCSSIKINVASPIFALPTFFLLNTSIHSGNSSTVLNFTFRGFYLPTDDIRVSIRSFQI